VQELMKTETRMVEEPETKQGKKFVRKDFISIKKAGIVYDLKMQKLETI
jgi:hypothetical protein